MRSKISKFDGFPLRTCIEMISSALRMDNAQLAQITLSTPNEVESWIKGTVTPNPGQEKRLSHLLQQACGIVAQRHIVELESMRFQDKEIADAISRDPATVTRWKTGQSNPPYRAVQELKNLLTKARREGMQDYFSHLNDKLDFLCSKATHQSPDHRRKAFAALQRATKGMNVDKPTSKLLLPLNLKILSSDLEDSVDAHCFADKSQDPPLFVILINAKLPKTKQKSALFRELQAHILNT